MNRDLLLSSWARRGDEQEHQRASLASHFSAEAYRRAAGWISCSYRSAYAHIFTHSPDFTSRLTLMLDGGGGVRKILVFGVGLAGRYIIWSINFASVPAAC